MTGIVTIVVWGFSLLGLEMIENGNCIVTTQLGWCDSICTVVTLSHWQKSVSRERKTYRHIHNCQNTPLSWLLLLRLRLPRLTRLVYSRHFSPMSFIQSNLRLKFIFTHASAYKTLWCARLYSFMCYYYQVLMCYYAMTMHRGIAPGPRARKQLCQLTRLPVGGAVGTGPHKIKLVIRSSLGHKLNI